MIEYLISQALCYANYTLKIIHLSNLTNTFYDLFCHKYLSPDSHMKEYTSPNHLKSDLQNVQYAIVSAIQMSGILIPIVVLEIC